MTKPRSNMARYGGSLAIVLGVHVVAVLLTLNWSVPQAIELPPAAMMVELAPLPEPAPPPPPKAAAQAGRGAETENRHRQAAQAKAQATAAQAREKA